MLADQMYYIRNSFGLVKSLFKVTLNQKSEVWTYPNSVWSDGVRHPWMELTRPYIQVHLKDAGY